MVRDEASGVGGWWHALPVVQSNLDAEKASFGLRKILGNVLGHQSSLLCKLYI